MGSETNELESGVRLLTRREFREATGIGAFKQRELEARGVLQSVKFGPRCVRIASTEIARLARRGA